MTDCGLTHFHDEDVRKALIELDPEGEKRIKESQFGEITGSYVPLSMRKGLTQRLTHLVE